MSISKQLIKRFEELKIKYKPIAHKTVYTAYDAATTMKAKLREIPKVLHVVADNKRNILVIVPADYQVDLAKLKTALRAKKVSLASEKVMKKIFKIKTGALSAFEGKSKDIEVFVDKAFAKTKKVVASAGTLTDSLEMKTKDFIKATEGKLVAIGKVKKFKKPKRVVKKKVVKKVAKKPAKKAVKMSVNKKRR